MEASPRPAFELSKWYLDAVGEDGEVFIGYRAALRWRGLRASYSAALTGGADEPRTAASVKSGAEPVLRTGSLAWRRRRSTSRGPGRRTRRRFFGRSTTAPKGRSSGPACSRARGPAYGSVSARVPRFRLRRAPRDDAAALEAAARHAALGPVPLSGPVGRLDRLAGAGTLAARGCSWTGSKRGKRGFRTKRFL